MFSIQILIKVQVEVAKHYLEVDVKTRMVIINMKVNLMEVKEETSKEKKVMEAMVKVIKVNNQITIQTAITVGNLSTWQRTIIKGSMMRGMENYNKGIMHQLAIKVMNNCL
jgi:hypothetical protein